MCIGCPTTKFYFLSYFLLNFSLFLFPSTIFLSLCIRFIFDCYKVLGILYLLLVFKENTEFYQNLQVLNLDNSDSKKAKFANPFRSLYELFTTSKEITVLVISNVLLCISIADQLATGVLYLFYYFLIVKFIVEC